jgi:hypothetical protein
MLILFFKLLIGHALADYALQDDMMVHRKNRRDLGYGPWCYWMTAHALINAGAVWIVSASAVCAVAELVLHWAIDFSKCEKWTNPHLDQLLHVCCKIGYVIALR